MILLVQALLFYLDLNIGTVIRVKISESINIGVDIGIGVGVDIGMP